MKKQGFAFAIAMIAFASVTNAQLSESAPADISSRVIAPIAISKSRDLALGVIAVGQNTAGAITIAATDNGTRSENNAKGFGTVSSAKYDVTGEPAYTYSVDVPATVTLTHAGDNTATIIFTPLKSDPTALNAEGKGVVFVGGTLNVPAKQKAGAYTGQFNVTVAYN